MKKVKPKKKLHFLNKISLSTEITKNKWKLNLNIKKKLIQSNDKSTTKLLKNIQNINKYYGIDIHLIPQ